MALRIELTGDRLRGPGYGQMRLSPFNAEDSVELLLESNQGKQPFLGANGEWSAQEVWHRIPVASYDGTAVTLDLSPSLVDPIATQPSRVLINATVRAAGVQDVARVMVKSLLASAASGERPDSASGIVDHTTVAQARPMHEPEPEPEPEAEPEPDPERQALPPPPPTGRKSPVIMAAGLALLLLAAGVASAWFTGLPPFDRADEQIAEQPAPEPPTDTDASPPAARTPASPGSITTLAELNSYLQTGPDAIGTRHTGDALLHAGKPDLALLAYQFSARQGDSDAGLAIARMYDPDTWSKETSPMPQPDAETAAYWYEPAAQAGHPEALRQLGKIMIQINPSGFQHDKGLEWLKKAADAGDEAAKALVQGN